jgi:hypothetical protein
VSNTHPAQGGVERVTVRTAAGATVTTSAHFKTALVVKRASANAFGVATVNYSVGQASTAYFVRVTVSVAKGNA